MIGMTVQLVRRNERAIQRNDGQQALCQRMFGLRDLAVREMQTHDMRTVRRDPHQCRTQLSNAPID